MAFGDYATLLSSFTGADESPISEGGKWSTFSDPLGAYSGAPWYYTGGVMVRESNHLGVYHYPGDGWPPGTYHAQAYNGKIYYNATNFGPDCEAYFTYSHPTSYNEIRLWLRFNITNSTTWEGYVLILSNISADNRISCTTGFAGSVGWVTAPQTTYVAGSLAVNDRIGLRIECKTLTTHLCRAGGSWTQIQSSIDTTIRNYATNKKVAVELSERNNPNPLSWASAWVLGLGIDDIYAGNTPVAYCPGAPDLYRLISMSAIA